MKGLRLFRFFALLALLSACRMVPEGDAVAKRETAGGVSVVAVQYVASVGILASWPTFTNLSHFVV